jgi:hypothetical protein
MVLVLAAAVLAVLLVVALVASLRGDRRSGAATCSAKLPSGAEAAILSILEAVPDPRNHLALTRDLTGEVRITGTPLDPALRSTATAPAPAAGPTSADLWGSDPGRVELIDGETRDRRALDRAS